MNSYSTGDLEKLLGEKGHIIRYWEKTIPLIQPRKDGGGRFVYSKRDIELLLRIKYLVHEKKYTVEGARDVLMEELSGAQQDIKAQIEALRSDLLNIYFINRTHTSPADGIPSPCRTAQKRSAKKTEFKR
ncbi:MAG: MerR family transcriptional regulator [Spirochaetaceae bacterium]|jgi:DNA-binding transcriptional MerR regulator|nr:MerR family transcriptional regulator [Spirochaetaceae bacterium]